MSYIAQINRAIDHIESNLLDAFTIADTAKEAGLSYWHFQRIFAATVGDTVADYISARRLSHAAMQLVTSSDRVIDIALGSEYVSHATFTRAFKRMFKMTPSRFRRAKKNAAIIPQKAKVTPAYLEHLHRGLSMQPEIIHLEEFTAIGIAGSFSPLGTHEPDNMIVIPKLWQTFRSYSGYLKDAVLGDRVGIIGAGGAPEGKLDFLAGKKLEAQIPVPDGFETRTVPAGDYAKFTHSGPLRTVNHTMHYIFGSWLPKSGRVLSEGPEFGLYPKAYEPTSEDGEMYIYVSLK